jgi:putative ABC transport system permease protein
MLGSGNGLRNGILIGFNGSATNSFFLWTQKVSKPYKGMKPGRNFNYNNSDTQALQKLASLEVVAPMNQLGGHDGQNNVVRGLKTAVFSVMGVFPVMRSIESIKIKEGRFLNDLDIKDHRKNCVIGKRVAEMLYKPNEKIIGSYIRISGVYFMVVGVTTPAGSGDQAREQAEKIHLPFTTFQKAFNFGDIVGWFAIKSAKNVPASVAEEEAMALLRERHKIAPDDKMAIGHWNMEKQYNKLTGLFSGIRILVWVVGTGTLLAGIIGVSNIMLIVVKERTKEIGVKRALGATPMAVLFQIILESVFLTAIAGYLGLVCGVGLLEVINKVMPKDENSMFQNPEIDLNIALIALTILIVAGGLAGLIPGKRAINISPVEALRAE